VPGLRSFDDPRLAHLRVGVPVIGNDMAASPPGAALARRGIVDNVIGYPPLGSTTVAERMLAALADGTLDVALLWAPQVGYFAARAPFEVTLTPAYDPQGLAPRAFPMAMAVRQDDPALRDALDHALVRLHDRIDAVLREYDVPDGGRSP
jgi:mxaJ protein